MKVVLISFLSILLLSCTHSEPQESKPFLENTITSHTDHLKIVESEKDTVAYILNPENGDIEKQFLLTKRTNYNKEGYTTIICPVPSLVTLSGTQIGMLDKLNETKRIVGVSSANYIHNKHVRRNIEEESVIELGDLSSLPVEEIVASKAKLILYSGFGEAIPNSNKLLSIGIESIPIYDWRENNPLGKAEWILFMGYLTDKVDLAKELFHYCSAEYSTLKQYAQTFEDSISVMVGNIYGDVWNTPAGESYMAQLLRDANVKYVYESTKGTGSILLTLEEVINKNSNTMYWINPEHPTKSGILNVNPKAKHLGPFQNNNVYCYSHGMNHYWEMAAIEPQLVLRDLINIFHKQAPDSELYYYKRVNL